ncbi:atypical chemokine receptor 1 [Anolis sagrei]|uniref:atypical chemokine receptor 1 n=1 Tax=Anolis sagrei TaxID=38937 RepID=UPI0035207623
MGNCIHANKSRVTTLDFEEFEDLLANFTSNYTYDEYPSYDGILPEPCQFTYCLNFLSSILALLVVISLLGLVSSLALGLSLAKSPIMWKERHPRKYQLFLMSGATGLFAATLPFFAVGIKHGWVFGPHFCQVARALKFGCLFAQGLMVAGSACHMPSAIPHSIFLTVLWLLGFLCATPAIVISSPGDDCFSSLEPDLQLWSLAHILVSLATFVILPLAMLVTKVALKWHGESKCIQLDLGWLFYIFWSPYGVVLLLDKLRQDGLITSTCRFQEHLDYFLGLSEGFGILHCFLLPLLILVSGICRRRISKAGGP